MERLVPLPSQLQSSPAYHFSSLFELKKNQRKKLNKSCLFTDFQSQPKKLITELVKPLFLGSFDKSNLSVRLKPSSGGTIDSTTTPYATFTASVAPQGSPFSISVSSGGVGNDTDTVRNSGVSEDP